MGLAAGCVALLPAAQALGGAPPSAAAGPRHGPRNVAVLVFPGVQVIDFAGPYEVFQGRGYRTYTVAERPDILSTNGRRKIQPTHTFADCPDPDIIVVPGGSVHEQETNPALIGWLHEASGGPEIVMSVCSGAFLLGSAGLLDGIEATTAAPAVAELQRAVPKARVVSGRRFVDAGKIVTAGGLSCGIDASLHVLTRLSGEARTREVAVTMEHDWDPRGINRRAALADLHLASVIDEVLHPRLSPRTLVCEGDTRRWDCVYEVGVAESPQAFISRIDEHLASVAHWHKTGGAPR